MKNILSLVVVMLVSFNLSAQKKTNGNAHLKSSGTYFENQVKDKKWSNTNGDSTTLAKYSEYEGVTYVKLHPEEDITVLFDYDISVEKGKLEVEIVDSAMNVVFQKGFDASEKVAATIALKRNEDYQMRFTGHKTKGSYFCKWTEK